MEWGAPMSPLDIPSFDEEIIGVIDDTPKPKIKRQPRLKPDSPSIRWDDTPPMVHDAMVLLESLYDDVAPLLMNGKVGIMRKIRKVLDLLRASFTAPSYDEKEATQ